MLAGARADLHDPCARRFALELDARSRDRAPEPTIEAARRVRDHLGGDLGVTPGTLEIGPSPASLLP